jgi:hypothetical protein
LHPVNNNPTSTQKVRTLFSPALQQFHQRNSGARKKRAPQLL